MNPFESYRECLIIKDRVKCRHIIVGDYSYYAGYYHGNSFEDCVMYLDVDDNHVAEEKMDRLIIGKFCSIASGAKFMMGGTQGHNYNWISSYPLDFLDDNYDGYANIPPKAHMNKGDTIIGNDVWIGTEALIMPGITIADGAVIGARSVVTKNVGAYEIWAGNPAKFIKKRFAEDKITKLLEVRWWDWNLEKLKDNLDLLRSPNIDGLVV